jgi:hypothetical protein
MAHTVLVDFETSKSMEDVEAQFAHADFVEGIGRNQYQVGFGVEAPNEGEAYRRAVNAVEASMRMLGTEPALLGGTVYTNGERGEEEMVFD